jgi:hypothetical protein
MRAFFEQMRFTDTLMTTADRVSETQESGCEYPIGDVAFEDTDGFIAIKGKKRV